MTLQSIVKDDEVAAALLSQAGFTRQRINKGLNKKLEFLKKAWKITNYDKKNAEHFIKALKVVLELLKEQRSKIIEHLVKKGLIKKKDADKIKDNNKIKKRRSKKRADEELIKIINKNSKLWSDKIISEVINEVEDVDSDEGELEKIKPKEWGSIEKEYNDLIKNINDYELINEKLLDLSDVVKDKESLESLTDNKLLDLIAVRLIKKNQDNIKKVKINDFKKAMNLIEKIRYNQSLLTKLLTKKRARIKELAKRLRKDREGDSMKRLAEQLKRARG